MIKFLEDIFGQFTENKIIKFGKFIGFFMLAYLHSNIKIFIFLKIVKKDLILMFEYFIITIMILKKYIISLNDPSDHK
jgi:hypothetical protein